MAASVAVVVVVVVDLHLPEPVPYFPIFDLNHKKFSCCEPTFVRYRGNLFVNSNQ